MKELDFFFAVVARDDKLTGSQFCVYTALLVCWQDAGFAVPFRTSRARVMRIARIRSKTTYHESIKALQVKCYISYEPSYQPKGSWVWMKS
jgi:hypothetical protein